MQRLKLSNINLCDNEIIEKLCFLIDERDSLQHLDLSWAKLTPKLMNQVMEVLAERSLPTIKSLNLSYNSLIQAPLDENLTFMMEAELQDSIDFINNLCDFVKQDDLLHHLDLSGMNFSTEQLLQVAQTTLYNSENLLALHLSDNGIRFNQELRDELLDMMGLSNNIYRVLVEDDFRINQRIPKPENLKKVIR